MITRVNWHRESVMRAGVSLAVGLVIACSTAGANAQSEDAAWTALKERTAWIIVGHVAAKDGTWATLPAYRMLGQSVIEHPRIPDTGDVLNITHDRPLYIRDFKSSGEARRLEWPGGRPLEDADLTGGVLRPGSRVVVKEVSRDTGSTCDTLCTVWARVSPEQSK
jgi:hypothetical protein